MPCCRCDCDATFANAFHVCTLSFYACIAAEIALLFLSANGLCVLACMLLGPLAPACIAACVAVGSANGVVLFAACLYIYAGCNELVELANDTCKLNCQVTGAP